MDYRAYILLDIVGDNAGLVADTLRKSRGVVTVDILEGPPDVIVVIEARGRRQLARLINHALTLVETVVEHVSVLPTGGKLNNATGLKITLRGVPSKRSDNSKGLPRYNIPN